jgi:GR25 family glycosyltransferase involved in LPS biosynthesis
MRCIFLMTLATFSFFIPLVESSLQDHFKKIEQKEEGGHCIRNIDFIYLINLDSRPEKWKKSIDQLLPYGIYPCRFSAVNGWELTVEDVKDIGLKYANGMKKDFLATCYEKSLQEPIHEEMKQIGKSYFRHGMTPGMIGCLLSHLSVLQDAYDSGYETIWVMEDDILVVQDPRRLSVLIDRLDQKVGKGKWDILFTDRDMRKLHKRYERCHGWSRRPNFTPKDKDRFQKSILIDGTFRKIGARFGTHSMILRRSGLKKILDFIKIYQPFNPYDLDMYLPEDIHLYALVHDVVTNNPGTLSDTTECHFEEGSF